MLRGHCESGITSMALIFLSVIFSNLILNQKFGIITHELTPDAYAIEKTSLELYLMLFSIVIAAFTVLIKQATLKHLFAATTLLERVGVKNYILTSAPLKKTVAFMPLILCLALFAVPSWVSINKGGEYNVALTAQVLKDYGLAPQAMQQLEKSLEKHPSNHELGYLYALYSITTDFYNNSKGKALKLLEQAQDAHPSSLSIKYHLSSIYKSKGDKTKAIQYALQATNKAPKNAFLNNYLGELYLTFDELEQAAEAFKKALDANPNDPMIMNNLSYILLELNQEELAALELAKNSVLLLPNKIFNKDTLAWAYYKNRRYTEALETINEIHDSIEYSDEINFHYIMILHSMSLIKNPIESIDKLLASPEVIMNNMLFRSITAARAELTAKLSNE